MDQFLKETVSVSVSVSAEDGSVALGKAQTRSTPSLSSLTQVALETMPINTVCKRGEGGRGVVGGGRGGGGEMGAGLSYVPIQSQYPFIT